MGEGEEEEGLLPFPQFPPHFQPGSYLVKSYSEAATQNTPILPESFILHISYIIIVHISYICSIIIYALRCMVYGVYCIWFHGVFGAIVSWFYSVRVSECHSFMVS